jgi:hypothetical protein
MVFLNTLTEDWGCLPYEPKQVTESVNILINKYFPTENLNIYLLSSTQLFNNGYKNVHFLHHLTSILFPWNKCPAKPLASAKHFLKITFMQ